MIEAATTPVKMDWRITLAILVTVSLEAIAGLVWIGAAMQRLDSMERRVEEAAPVAERLARLEVEIVSLRTLVDRIDARLDRSEADQ